MSKWRKRLGDSHMEFGLFTQKRSGKGYRIYERGFTLIELLVVMAILGFAIAIGAVQFKNSQAHQELDRAARELAADIRWMQQMSANDATPRLSEATPLTYRYHLILKTDGYLVRDENEGKVLKERQFNKYRVGAAVLMPDGMSSIDMTFYAYDLDRLRDINDSDSLENTGYRMRLTHNITHAVRDVNVAARVGRVWISR